MHLLHLVLSELGVSDLHFEKLNLLLEERFFLAELLLLFAHFTAEIVDHLVVLRAAARRQQVEAAVAVGLALG